MATVAAAFPFIEVKIDTSGLTPVALRSPGVIAIVGKSTAGSAAVNIPLVVDGSSDVDAKFGAASALGQSLKLAMAQDPKPSKIYGVKVDTNDYRAALSTLEAADDVTFVSLANETDAGTGGATPTNLNALKSHVETMSSDGLKRIGVAMIDPTTAKSNSYVTDVDGVVASLKSDSSRMIMIAARGATTDAASAAMAAIAGFAPHQSMVLKKVRGVSLPAEKQYSPAEIKGLSGANIIPIIDPAMIVGESLHFAEGRCYTTDASLLYIDIVRTLDDIEFRLKAGLIGMVGDARITKSGLNKVKTRVEGILGPLVRRSVITDFKIEIPVLNILSIPESARTPTDTSEVTTARANRTVEMFLSVTYGPAVHLLKVTLAPKF